MGVDWVLYKADPRDFGRLADAEAIEPRFWPGDIDAILTGSSDGPFEQFFREYVEIQQGEHGIYGFPADVVKRFASRLAAIRRSDFAPLDVVLRETGITVDEKDKQSFYNELSELAERIQRFVGEAASQGNAIRMEAFG